MRHVTLRRNPMLKRCISLITLAILLAATAAEAGRIGVRIKDRTSSDGKFQGVEVVEVQPGGPAARAGLIAGDVIVSAEGRALASAADLDRVSAVTPAGQPLHLTVTRNDQRLNFKVIAGEAPNGLVYVRKGREETTGKKYDEAVKSYTMAIEADPSSDEAYFGRADAYMGKKNYDAAIADYSRYLEMVPSSWVGYHRRAVANEKRGRRDDAVRDYTKALDLKPGFPYSARVLYDRGQVLYEKGAHDPAIEDFNGALQIDPRFTPAYEMRGNAYMKKKEFSRAKDDHETAAKLYLEQGMEVAKEGNTDGAVNMLDVGIRLDTSQTAALYYHRGLLMEKKGDHRRAVADYTAAIQRNPSYADAYRRRGTLYAEKMGDREKGNRDWERAASLESAASGSRATTGLVCPAPVFGKLLWSGSTPRCPEGFALIPGWRFKQENTPWVCAKCTPNCAFVEEPDRTYICAGLSASGRTAAGGPTTGRSGGDSLLGQTWVSSDQKPKGTAGATDSAPRSESEVRPALEKMGFRIVRPGMIGAFQGYWIEIVDPAEAARYGFGEKRQARASAPGRESTSTIGCWTEKQGDRLVIWMDGRDVSVRDGSKLPTWVRIYAK